MLRPQGCRDEAWLHLSPSLGHIQPPPRCSLCLQTCLLFPTSLPSLVQSCCLMSFPGSHEHHPHSCPGWRPLSPAWPPSSLCRRAGGTQGLWEDPPRLINGLPQCPRGATSPPPTMRQVSKAGGHTWAFYWVWGKPGSWIVSNPAYKHGEGALYCWDVQSVLFVSPLFFSFWLHWVFVASFSSCSKQEFFFAVLGLLIVVASLVMEALRAHGLQ